MALDALQDQLTLDALAADLLFREARTASEFLDEPVSDEQLRAIFELARMGPTAMNIQPLRVTWIRSADARERLLPHMAEGNRAKTAAAPVVAVLGYDVDWHEHLPVVFPPAAGKQEMFAGNEELRERMGRDNAHLQAGYFVLAVRAVGLAAGPMGGFDPAGVDAEFHAGTTRRSLLVVNIGAPAAPRHDRLPRLDFDTATSTV
ncbi:MULTISPECIES: malonic semialdehyde reductase [Kocuria]|uniref:Nitroreductase family protein n=1 Tax=Kocuria rosea subsp. polaris TaxID=136273 RepID=A0A0W8INL1_KOCRO|nr:malonic semialdehyde reductase [Kocuria polaris]KUG61751.1 nitroreductase family protein [Kocuria polaris]